MIPLLLIFTLKAGATFNNPRDVTIFVHPTCLDCGMLHLSHCALRKMIIKSILAPDAMMVLGEDLLVTGRCPRY